MEMAEWAAATSREQLSGLGIGAPHATTLGRAFQRLDAELLDQLAGGTGAGGNDRFGDRP